MSCSQGMIFFREKYGLFMLFFKELSLGLEDRMKKVLLCGEIGKGRFALVDSDDYERVSKFKWYLGTHGYATTTVHVSGNHKKKNIVQRSMSLHRTVLGLHKGDGMVVDHRNRNRLDCRRSNLRVTDYYGNAWNVVPQGVELKGIVKVGARFIARIIAHKQSCFLGSFGSAKEAAMVYDKAARHFFGEFAYLNYPEEYYLKPVRYVDFEPTKHVPVSKYIGVSYFGHGGKRVKRWRAVYQKKTLGYFKTELEAAVAFASAKGVKVEDCVRS